jgi:4-amino-4-deoxy-L-arabinose transferase-like glycosyltransferase
MVQRIPVFLKYVALGILALFLFVPGLKVIPMLDRDSAHFAQASKQMIESGDYWTIRFQDHPRHLKPPGIYWLQALSVKLFSPHTLTKVWPYRLPNLFFGIGLVWLIFAFSRSLTSEKTAFVGALIMAQSVLLNIEIRQTVTDTVFLFFNVLMFCGLWQFYVAYKDKQPALSSRTLAPQTLWIPWGCFWGGMAFGIFIKGISPILALVVIFGLVIADREFAFIKVLKPIYGILFVIILTLLWLLPFSFYSHHNFLWDMIVGDVLPKLVGGQESHGMPPGYFAIIFGLMFWPAALYFFKGVAFWRESWQEPRYRFLLIAATAIWILCECIPTKLPEYILPAYPWLAIYLAHIYDKKNTLQGFLHIADRTFTVITFVVSLSILFLSVFLIDQSAFAHKNVLYLIAISYFLLMCGHFYSYLTLQPLKMIVFAYFSSVFLYWLVFHAILPELDELWLPLKISKLLIQQRVDLTSQQPLIVIGYTEPSLVFYLGTLEVLFLEPKAFSVKFASKFHYFLINRKEVNATFLNGKKLGEINGFNYNNGHFMSLELIKK